MSPEGVREEARIFSTLLNFQLYIEIFLIQLQQQKSTLSNPAVGGQFIPLKTLRIHRNKYPMYSEGFMYSEGLGV